MSPDRQEKWSNRVNASKLRTKTELKEAILNVLKANKGHILSAEELHRALPVKRAELFAFREAFNELVDEGKIKQHISLP